MLHRTGGKDDGGVDLQGWWWLPDIFEGVRDDGVHGRRGAWKVGSNSPDVSSSTSGLKGLEIPGVLDREKGQGTQRPRLIRIRVLAQCKAERKKLGPNYIRELEGTFLRYAHLARMSVAMPRNVDNDTSLQEGNEAEADLEDSESMDIVSTYPSYALATAVVVSQSAFTPASIKRAMSSHVPFLLIHLPSPPSPSSPSQSQIPDETTLPISHATDLQEDVAGSNAIGGAIWNPALAGQEGVLRGALELRWERSLGPDGAGRPGLWWNGEKLGCYVPSNMR